MPFIDGLYQRIHSWVSDRDNKVPITAKRMDDETDGLVAALNSQNNELPRKGALLNVKGSVGSPAYTFTEDDDTGVFSPGDDIIALAVGGRKTFETASFGTSISNDLLLSGLSIIGQQSDILLSEKHRVVHSSDSVKIRVGHEFANGREVFTNTGKGASLIEFNTSTNLLTFKVADSGAAGQLVDWATTLNIPAVGDVQLNGAKVWTSANDGINSGLDADLLGGHSASYFLGADTVVPIDKGGTGAVSADLARSSLSVYSREEVDANIGNGPAGPQGPQGNTGDTGPAGPQGPAGESGNQDLADVLSNGGHSGNSNIIMEGNRLLHTNNIMETTPDAGVNVEGVNFKDDGIAVLNGNIQLRGSYPVGIGNTCFGLHAGQVLTEVSKTKPKHTQHNVLIGGYGGNSDSLDIRGTDNNAVLSNGLGRVFLHGKTVDDTTTVDIKGYFSVNTTGAIDRILDEDDMASNSHTTLATQASIKAYVDANVSGSSVITLPQYGSATETTANVDHLHGVEHLGKVYVSPRDWLDGVGKPGPGILIVHGSKGHIQKYSVDINYRYSAGQTLFEQGVLERYAIRYFDDSTDLWTEWVLVQLPDQRPHEVTP